MEGRQLKICLLPKSVQKKKNEPRVAGLHDGPDAGEPHQILGSYSFVQNIQTVSKKALEMAVEDLFMNNLIVDKVFSFLKVRHLKRVALVSKAWRRLVENPKYWSNVTLKIRDESIFTSPRIMAVRKFYFRSDTADTELVNHFFRFVTGTEGYLVKYLSFYDMDLSTCLVNMPSFVCKVVEMKLEQTELLTRQFDELFTAINQSSILKLKKLVVEECNIGNTNAESLGAAVAKLEEVSFMIVDLEQTHVEAIFRAINQTPPNLLKLRKFSLYVTQLYGVPPNSLRDAVCKVEKVGFTVCEFTRDQLDTMLAGIASCGKLKLKTLVLYDCDLEKVNHDVLATAATKLKELDLTYSELTTQHLDQLCTEIAECESLSLKTLSLYSVESLININIDVLTRAILKLEVVDLDNYLSDDQVNNIFNRIYKSSNVKLKKLFIEFGGNEVNQELLKEAVKKVYIHTDCGKLCFI